MCAYRRPEPSAVVADTVPSDPLKVALKSARDEIARLKCRNRRLESMANFAHEGLITAGRDGTIEEINDSARRLFGDLEGENVKNTILDLVRSAEAERMSDSVVAKMPLPYGYKMWQGVIAPENKHDYWHGVAELVEIHTPNRGTIQARLAIRYERNEIGDPLWLHVSVIDTEELVRDPLTGLHFRRSLFRAVEREIARQERNRKEGRPVEKFSLLFVDADHFKSINDTYGHQAGDLALKRLAKKVVKMTAKRKTDMACRYGGEEIVLLVHLDMPAAVDLAEQLRQGVQEITVEGAEFQEPRQLTVSVGAATYQSGDDTESFLKRADEATYDAKAAGRNCVCVR